jgi:hypothetical protein
VWHIAPAKKFRIAATVDLFGIGFVNYPLLHHSGDTTADGLLAAICDAETTGHGR